MKGEVPKPLIVIVVAILLAVGGFFAWKSSQPTQSDVVLPDAGTMSSEEIAKLKNQDHAADEARARG